jgi:haloacetate dehalogenase
MADRVDGCERSHADQGARSVAIRKGETDKPSSGYDKRTMATDLRELMFAVNIPKIALVAHDHGARVATRSAKDHPEAVDRLVVMDNVPTRIVGRELDAAKAKGFSATGAANRSS